MAPSKQNLLSEIEAFLTATGMGESYFGKLAAGNSELVARLRNQRRVWPETERKIRSFMKAYGVRNSGHKHGRHRIQGRPSQRAS